MVDNKMGSYHLSDNPALYEVARTNHFEFVEKVLDGLENTWVLKKRTINALLI